MLERSLTRHLTCCRITRCSSVLLLLLSCMCLGCYSSSSDSDGTAEPASDEASGNVVLEGGPGITTAPEDWPTDVPFIPVMTQVDGIPIVRTRGASETLSITGEIPVDVGNTWAEVHPSKPEKGGSITIRLSAEPKTMNPIVETSAVQTYVAEYVNEALVRQNPETLEFEPHIATAWVTEDSVKLAPDYDEDDFRVAVKGQSGGPTTEVQIADRDESVTLVAADGAGQAAADIWVGLFPTGENMPGAPSSGYHFWSDASGEIVAAGLVPGSYEARIGREVFGTTETNEDGNLVVTPESPGNPLAERLNADGKESLVLAPGEWVDVQRETVYTFSMRPEVVWSDGKPFTSQDLEFAYAVINNPFVDGESLRVYYQDLVSCDAIDAHTIRMKYRQQYFKAFEFTAGMAFYSPPWHYFVDQFAKDGKKLTMERLSEEEEKQTNRVSVHGATFGKFFNTSNDYNFAPLGTGPYVVSKWERSDRIELTRNENYWNTEREPYLDRLVFKFIPENPTALLALKSGEIDFLYRMDSEQYFKDLEQADVKQWFDADYVKASWFVPSFSYIGWNMLRPKFQDRRVRIALSLLFDAEEFVEKKLSGAAVLVSGSQYIFGWGYDHRVPPLGYDPEAARELLAEAGWIDTDGDGVLDKDSEKFAFTMLYPPGNPVVDDMLEILQEDYKDAGIQMELRRFEWASFIDKVKAKDFDAVRLGWASPVESDPFQIWHSSGAVPEARGSNHVSFANAQADELIEKLRLTLDRDKREKIHSSFHRILDREQPYLFLYTSKDFGAYHKRIRGVKWYRIRPGFDLTEWYIPKDEQR